MWHPLQGLGLTQLPVLPYWEPHAAQPMASPHEMQSVVVPQSEVLVSWQLQGLVVWRLQISLVLSEDQSWVLDLVLSLVSYWHC
mmetsp:Transcript_2599/g.6239  ORF Transcript_2599/g.6239 Transcript_2599/m.6239 type:complete len:84 (+) Transcript_2599:1744-1995(+)